jgi:hypothetical protein
VGYLCLLHQIVSSAPGKGGYLSAVAGGVHPPLLEGAGDLVFSPPLGCACTMCVV